MLFGLLVALYAIVCLFLILLVLIQQGKSSMGLGNIGGGSQMLFGGSGGQDILQKTTWVLGALFMAGSLGLALLQSTTYRGHTLGRVARTATHRTAPVQPIVPTEVE